MARASVSPEAALSFRTLHESALVSVLAYRCRACRAGPTAEEHSERSSIVFLRRGAFRGHFGARSATVDVNEIAFFSRGTSYRVSHPAHGGDAGTVLALAPEVLLELRCEREPALAEHPDAPLPFASGPCEPELLWRHHAFARRLAAGAPAERDALWADAAALELAAAGLAAAHARHGLTRRARRADTERDHAERAEAARAYLAGHLGERVTLAHVARAVHASPFHLARLFRRHSGLPLHRYFNRLRLRTALERVLGGADDLTALALELGFASHSHFGEAFRREFGCAPSAVRRAGPSALRETSKTPIV